MGDSKQISGLFREMLGELSSQRRKVALSVGLLTVYLVNNIQFRLTFHFDLFGWKNFRFGSENMQ